MIVEDKLKSEISPEDKKKLFFKGLEHILRNWVAFRLAIDNNSSKVYNSIVEVNNKEELEFNFVVDNLYEMVCTILIKEKSENFRLEKISDLLKDFFQDFFNTELNDQSEIDVSKHIVKMFNFISKNDFSYVQVFEKLVPSMEFIIPFPCSTEDDVEYSDDEFEIDDEVVELDEDEICIKKKKNKEEIPPELLEDFEEKNKIVESKLVNEVDNNKQEDGFVTISKKSKKK